MEPIAGQSSLIHSQSPAQQPQDEVAKRINIIVCGDRGSGRQSLVKRFMEDKFEQNFLRARINGDIFQKLITINNKRVNVRVFLNYDEKDANHLEFNGVDGVVFVYDPTNSVSFDNIKQWKQLADRHCTENCKGILVATKNDLRNENSVDSNFAKEFAANLNLDFIETSAKTSSNVQTVFETIASHIINNVQRSQKTQELQPVIVHKSWRWGNCLQLIRPILFALAGLVTMVAARRFFSRGPEIAIGVGLLLTSIAAFSLMYRNIKRI